VNLNQITGNIFEKRTAFATMTYSLSRTTTPKRTQSVPLAKCIMLGEGGVGKTSIVRRLVSDDFGERYPCTIGVAFHTKTMEVDKQQVKLQLWDTAGQERYHSMSPMYCRGANCAIVVYDISDSKSFERVPVRSVLGPR